MGAAQVPVALIDHGLGSTLKPSHSQPCASLVGDLMPTERQLKESLREVGDLKAALDEHAIVATTDPQGRITYVNDRFCAISRYAREELIGQDHRIINSGHHPSGFFKALWKTIAAGKVWRGEIRNRAKDGSFYWVDTTIVPFLDDEGRPRQYVAIRADITVRKRAEENLRTSLTEIGDLKRALDEHAIVAITDPQGRITDVNDKFCAISKFTREELIGQDHRIINSGHHPPEFFQTLWRTISRGKVWHGEIRNRAKDGSFYWVDTTIVPFLDETGRPRQYVAIRADTTERKRVEEEIRELNAQLEQRVARRTVDLEAANRELEAFSYSVSHDLRSPLRTLNGFSQAVLEDYGSLLPAEGQRYLQTIRTAAQRMGDLIDDLLALSRLSRQPIKRQVIDNGALVRAVVEELRALEPGRVIGVEISNLAEAVGDFGLIRQVWMNLISNAFKYTGRNPMARVEISSKFHQGECVYCIRDNGTGFDMRYVGKLFGVFQRLHRVEEFPGTGVGLAIVQRIVHRHGGRVWAEGAVGEGATFSFTLGAEEVP